MQQLNSDDLQAIGELIDERLGKRMVPLEERFDKRITSFENQVNNRFSAVDNHFAGIEKDVHGMKQDMRGVKKDIHGMKKDISVIVDTFDRRDLELHHRLDNVDAVLHISR